ncbi:MAG: DUF58 domain-containing protein [Thermodesulfobacteriota bacterium]
MIIKRSLYHAFRGFFGFTRWMGRRFTPAGLLVVFGLFFSAFLGLDTRRSLAYQIFTLLACLVTMAVAAGLLFRGRFQAERILPRFGTVGLPLNYRVVIRNTGSKPLSNLLLFEDLDDPRPDFRTFLENPEPGEARRNRIDRFLGYYRWTWLISNIRRTPIRPHSIGSIPAGGQATVPVETVPSRRGVHRFTGISIGRPDPLGLFLGMVSLSLPQPLMVLPRRYPLPPIRLPGTRKYQSGGVALTSSVGDSEEFISLRDYRPGDPLRRIHWKSWAKTGRPVVKEYQSEFYVRHALILDTFQESAFSPRFEEAVSVAASFAFTVGTQESLLDLMFIGPRAFCFTSGRSLGEVNHTLEILASVKPCRDRSFQTLTALVTERAPALSGCICVLLSWDKDRKDMIGGLRRIGIPVLVLVVSDAEAFDSKTGDLGPMADAPEFFHRLKTGRIGEGLARL